MNHLKCPTCDHVAESHARLNDHIDAVHRELTFECPRQREGAMFPFPEHRSFWRADGTCSHCGSVSPATFFKAIEDGQQVVPTDKAYKAYIGGWRKFYFQHLSDTDQAKFIELYKAGKMKFAMPGHFYVRPYFCREVESS